MEPNVLPDSSSHPGRPLVAIVGPSGAGKSWLALRVAEWFHGEIVNCDSLQLYAGFDIGSAKLPVADRRGIPHHMFDVLDPRDEYSAGEYARHARPRIAGISARGNLPVITGGTGFYLRALLYGLPQLPERDQALRARLTARDASRPGILHRILKRLDPTTAARIHAHDTHKLIRALEVRMLTRQPLPPAAAGEAFAGYRTLEIGLDPGRERLSQALDSRTEEMFRSGLVDEVRRLLAGGCSGLEKPFESLGYKQALRYVRGSVTLKEDKQSAQIA